MARAGMTRWRSRNCAPVTDGCDEVQKSLDLLDRVLSEFDDFEAGGNSEVENAQLTTTVLAVRGDGSEDPALISNSIEESEKNVSDQVKTPEDESPCSGGQGGHQSEDDGYMSMNGRKAKLMLTSTSDRSGSTASSIELTNGDRDVICITPDTPQPLLPLYDRAASRMRQPNGSDFPPPPEVAQRIISTLLPRVSPCSSSQRKSSTGNCMNHSNRKDRQFLKTVVRSFEEKASSQFKNHENDGNTIATQTTLPKTKHQRPYGWHQHLNQNSINSYRHGSTPGEEAISSVAAPSKIYVNYGSLPYDGPYYQNAYVPACLSSAMPPSTVGVTAGHHRETKRCATEHNSNQEEAVLNSVQELTDDDPANFSDDSLEDVPPPPPAAAAVAASLALQCANKRGSIAWEVSLDSDDEGVNAKSKVVGQRRKKSGDYSSTGSLTMLDWPAPPNNASDFLTSDTDVDSLCGGLMNKKMHFNGGTYIIRKYGRKDRKQLLTELKTPVSNHLSSGLKGYSVDETDLKRCSSTFDNIKTLLKEGLVEGLDDSPPDFQPPRPPNLSRGLSLPNIVQTDRAEERDGETKTSFINESVSSVDQLFENDNDDDKKEDEARVPCSVSKSIWTECDIVEKQSVAVQVSADFTQLNKEISEQSTSCQTDNEELDFCVSKAMNTAVNITSTGTFKRERKIDQVDGGETCTERMDKKKELKLEIAKPEVVAPTNAWNSTASLPEIRKVSVSDNTRLVCNGFEKPHGDFRVNVEILQHEFGPLPPSPVEEVDDEYADVLQSVPTSNRKADSLHHDSTYRRSSRLSASGSIRSSRMPDLPPNSSLKTRSVDASFTRNHRTHFSSSSRKEIPVERRTLPTDLPGGTALRRPFQKRSSHSPKEEPLQLPQHSSQPHVSCSLPETPIFARGCDIPRTPLRNSNTADKTNVRTTPRLDGIQMSGFMRNVGAGHGTCLGEAMAGAELLRLTGPGRGWYPRHRQPRPASVEHLDRLAPQGLSPNTPSGGAWETRESRKPLTLPPNLSPKFFQRSPREALRRVTSLLIRKGGSTKDTKSKDVLTSSVIGPHGDFGETTKQQKRGFFRGLWKRSRHYSLDQQQ